MAAFEWLREQTELRGVVPGKYLAVRPVYVVQDHPGALTFTVAADACDAILDSDQLVSEDATPRRAYSTSTINRRLHQR